MPDHKASPGRLSIYGYPASQPTRAVWWACIIKKLPFEIQQSEKSQLTRLNPKGQVPTIDDNGFTLYEMSAILTYLAEKHAWSDLYPEDIETRARINQYLNFHHTTTRLATFQLMGPHVTIIFGPAFGEGSLDPLMVDTIMAIRNSDKKLKVGQEAFSKQIRLIEEGYFFNDAPFVCGTQQPTLADIACYEELSQLTWANLFKYDAYPKIEAWLKAMSNLSGHDLVHRYNIELGDISTTPLTMDRFQTANEMCLSELAKTGIKILPA